jgi:MoxR-like ATPase
MPIDPRAFTGDGKRRYAPVGEPWPRPEHYRAEEPLVEAVNAALFLRRPLLLEGDPGAGKTRLAYAAAWELNWPLHACYVRSSSRVEDLLYEFDQLERLYDIQASCVPNQGEPAPLKPKKGYRKLRPLGQAVEDAGKGIPSVVLIDEIDKADIDFPNDLLQVLEEWRFFVKENENEEVDALKGKTVGERKDALPLVVVTSNRERELPAAFLRRCLYFFIEFPKADKLVEILKAHAIKPVDLLFETAVKRFMDLRDAFRWRKPPGTSELIDWVRLLENAVSEGRTSIDEIKTAATGHLPFRETFVKNQADRDAVAALERK